jgi:hypothetical protein
MVTIDQSINRKKYNRDLGSSCLERKKTVKPNNEPTSNRKPANSFIAVTVELSGLSIVNIKATKIRAPTINGDFLIRKL